MANSIIKSIMEFTPVSTSSGIGSIRIPIIKLVIVFGSLKADSFSYYSTAGKYRRIVDLSSYGCTGAPVAFVSPRYGAGIPVVGIGNLSTSEISLLIDVNLADAYVNFMVISPYA